MPQPVVAIRDSKKKVVFRDIEPAPSDEIISAKEAEEWRDIIGRPKTKKTTRFASMLSSPRRNMMNEGQSFTRPTTPLEVQDMVEAVAATAATSRRR